MARNALGSKLLETVVEHAPVRLTSRADHKLLETTMSDNRVLNRTLEWVGWQLFNFQGNEPNEVQPTARRGLAQRAKRAFFEDALAGAAVKLYNAFVFGRGVPTPQAHDPEFQKVLDEAWEDSDNKRILTRPDKLAEKGIDLQLQANVFFLLYDDGQDGRVKLDLLAHDTVESVVRHPKQRLRILYYVAHEKRQKWDYTKHQLVDVPTAAAGGPSDSTKKVVYYESLDAFDPEDQAQAILDADLEHPPEGALGRGKVVHLAHNKTSEMAFGVPEFKRLLRWFTAYNEMVASLVDRMKAAAEVYMKTTVKGSKRNVDKASERVLKRVSPLGAASYGIEDTAESESARGTRQPGELFQGEGINHEPFKIDTGSSEVEQGAGLARSQIAAERGFGPHYFGGLSDASLAGATSVELPALKQIEQAQDLWAIPFEAFADRVIANAVEKGMVDEWREPTDEEQMRIDAGEAEDLELDAAGRVKRDQGYEFALPSPLRRTMLDVVNAASQVAKDYDPYNERPELSRYLFGWVLAEGFGVQDPSRTVDEIFPRELERAEQAPSPAEEEGRAGPQSNGSQPVDRAPRGEAAPYRNTPRDAQTPEEAARRADAPAAGRLRETPRAPAVRGRMRRASAPRRRSLDRAFTEDVTAAAEEQLTRLAPTSGNGAGPH